MRKQRAFALAALLTPGMASIGDAATARRADLHRETVEPRIEAEQFEKEGGHAERRAKDLTDTLKIRGKGPFFRSLGMSAGLRGDEAGARESFEKMIENAPSEDEGFQQLGDSHFVTGDFASAAKLYTAAMVRAPQSEPFYRARRARAYIEMGDAKAALRDAEASLAFGGAPSEVYLVKTRALMRLDAYDAAAKAYDELFANGRRRTTPEDEMICQELKKHGRSAMSCRP